METWTEVEITGGKVLVDNRDLHLLENVKWYVGNKGYARRNTPAGNGKQGHELLHVVIMKRKSTDMVDHILGDKLDNRRSQLRVCSNEENSRNRRKASNNTSGYKGVTYLKKYKTWHARISLGGKYRSLGTFKCIKDAALAYNFAAAELYGEFARLNEVPQPWLEQA